MSGLHVIWEALIHIYESVLPSVGKIVKDINKWQYKSH